MFAEVIIPLQLRQSLTYEVPPDLVDRLEVGFRVEVQLGSKRRYAGIVVALYDHYDGVRKPRQIYDVLDTHPIIHPWQIELWEWISTYYMCTPGEVLHAALPSGLKLNSESMLILNGEPHWDQWELNDGEQSVLQALYHRNEISIEEVASLVSEKHTFRVIKSLLDRELVIIKERLKEKATAKSITYYDLHPGYQSEEAFLMALDSCQRAPKQYKILLALFDMRRHGLVLAKELRAKTGASSAQLKSLVNKGFIERHDELAHKIIQDQGGQVNQLNEAQGLAWQNIQDQWQNNPVVLLEGVTGSGKTHVYIEAIQRCISEGKQALYLLPEIALTTQLIQRLQSVFGEQLVTYHSRLNDRDRSAVYEVVRQGHPIVIGARSSLLLPFDNLGLIIVDEEHDSSYKQMDPAPRYNARDTAVYMAHKWNIPVLMGTATPSLETLHNVQEKKYGYAQLTHRFADSQLPELVLVDLREAQQKNQTVEFFTSQALEEMEKTLDEGRQILVFQNRRGHSNLTKCGQCGWTAGCIKCDVSLTYHKVFQDLRCHYCGYREKLPRTCPDCGNPHLNYSGLGTQKIETLLSAHFPDARIARMDLDTARGNKARSMLIDQMQTHDLDVLVGTQMITKGLDFEKIGLVVVPQADQLLFYPDFRTNEKAFQMLTQVSGRAGRKELGSKVLIQTYNPAHPVLRALKEENPKEFLAGELSERKGFIYPPYYRLIRIEIKHKIAQRTQAASEELALRLKHVLKNRIIGPAEPSIARIRNQYVRHIYIKHEKANQVTTQIKGVLQSSIDEVVGMKGMSGVRFNINVDPL